MRINSLVVALLRGVVVDKAIVKEGERDLLGVRYFAAILKLSDPGSQMTADRHHGERPLSILA